METLHSVRLTQVPAGAKVAPEYAPPFLEDGGLVFWPRLIGSWRGSLCSRFRALTALGGGVAGLSGSHPAPLPRVPESLYDAAQAKSSDASSVRSHRTRRGRNFRRPGSPPAVARCAENRSCRGMSHYAGSLRSEYRRRELHLRHDLAAGRERPGAYRTVGRGGRARWHDLLWLRPWRN